MKQEIWFIINPTSGISNKKRIENQIRSYLDAKKFNYSIIYTEYSGHGAKIAKQGISEKVAIICAVGGDGTVHEIAVELIHSHVKLAIIPSGSGNGFARHFSISERIKKSVQTINQGNFTLIDTATVNGVPFVQVAGVGYDAKIAFDMVNNRFRGLFKYIYLICKSYFQYKGTTVEIENKVGRYFMATVANTKEFGNGFQISPTSKANDGKLELILVKKPPIYDFPFMTIRFLAGTSNRSKYVETAIIEKITFKSDSNYFQMDGEGFLNKFSELHFQIVPNSLYVIHP
jgi:YegS/Rv2252/BmrU family lipid kinase